MALPLLLVAGLLATRRRRRGWPMALIGVAAAVSLAWSVVNTGSDPGIAYFSTLTRAWKFLAGAMLTALPRVLAPGVRRVAGWAGLVAILASALLLDGGSVFPGAVALLPVLGSVAVIAAGNRGPVAVASRWRPITWTGDVSYAVYLWHWPLIVLVPFATNAALSTTHKVLIIAATLGLAAVSTSLVEQPPALLHRWRSGWPARAVVAGCLSMSVIVAGVASYGTRTPCGSSRSSSAAAQERLASGACALSRRRCHGPLGDGCDDQGPPPAVAGERGDQRLQSSGALGLVGDPGPAAVPVRQQRPPGPTGAGGGDSHNNVFLPAYEIMADRLGWQMEVAGRASCGWSDRPEGGGSSATIAAECNGWKQRAPTAPRRQSALRPDPDDGGSPPRPARRRGVRAGGDCGGLPRRLGAAGRAGHRGPRDPRLPRRRSRRGAVRGGTPCRGSHRAPGRAATRSGASTR